jgi:hypothetical protein
MASAQCAIRGTRRFWFIVAFTVDRIGAERLDAVNDPVNEADRLTSRNPEELWREPLGSGYGSGFL